MFSLALRLGRTVAELEESIGSRELDEWFAFFTLGHHGPPDDEPAVDHEAVSRKLRAAFTGIARRWKRR